MLNIIYGNELDKDTFDAISKRCKHEMDLTREQCKGYLNSEIISDELIVLNLQKPNSMIRLYLDYDGKAILHNPLAYFEFVENDKVTSQYAILPLGRDSVLNAMYDIYSGNLENNNNLLHIDDKFVYMSFINFATDDIMNMNDIFNETYQCILDNISLESLSDSLGIGPGSDNKLFITNFIDTKNFTIDMINIIDKAISNDPIRFIDGIMTNDSIASTPSTHNKNTNTHSSMYDYDSGELYGGAIEGVDKDEDNTKKNSGSKSKESDKKKTKTSSKKSDTDKEDKGE